MSHGSHLMHRLFIRGRNSEIRIPSTTSSTSFPFSLDIDSMKPFSSVANFFSAVYIFSWDIVLVLCNLALPKRPNGFIVPEGHPGFGGKWPEHIPPKEGDSRCSCPAL